MYVYNTCTKRKKKKERTNNIIPLSGYQIKQLKTGDCQTEMNNNNNRMALVGYCVQAHKNVTEYHR